MSEVSSQQSPEANATSHGFNLLGAARRLLRGDLVFAFFIVCVLAVLLAPMPKQLLDFALAISITLSVMVLMTSLFIEKPLEFSAFPTVLLIATMVRLSLNLASTRLILSDGHKGTDAAGEVIQAFGSFVMQGNVVIGIIVFSILVLVNFIVITKGSGRIAEVAARFTLDAMPGKQMAIDADLSAGLIDENTAREKRSELEAESNFFGAMDGASKFVRGDAIAGLLITVINVVGGIIIGVAQNNMSFSDASSTYTLLTVGDGLVSQIPALIVSTAAGLLVSKAGVVGAADKALLKQFTNYPQTLGMASVVMAFMALLPGIPLLPFGMMAVGAGTGAWYIKKSRSEEVVAEQLALETAKTEEEAKPSDETPGQLLALDNLRLELGYGLLSMINDTQGHRLTDQIKALRKQIAQDMGFVMPSVRILDNMQMGANTYSIRVKEIEVGSGELRIGQLLAMDPQGAHIDLPGEQILEPTFSLPATWIDEGLRDEATFRGYTVVDPATVLTTHLTEILKDNMSELLSYAETRKLLDDLPEDHKKLVDDVVPTQISISGIQRVLQTLLIERISIRDLPTVLEGIAEATSYSQNVILIAEHVRSRLSRQISNTNSTTGGYLPIITLSPQWEQLFAESIIGQGDERQLSMAPSQLQDFIAAVREGFDDVMSQGESPILLTSPAIRPYVRSIIERFRSQTVVMSQNEVHPQARLKTLAQI
jgi:flagellar biosynthesis protein FlhA